MTPNKLRDGFPICHFAHNYNHNSKTEARIKTFTYQTIVLLSEISIHLVRAVCHIQSISMDPKTHRNHLPMRHSVFTYTQNSKLQVVCGRSTNRTTVLLSEISILYMC